MSWATSFGQVVKFSVENIYKRENNEEIKIQGKVSNARRYFLKESSDLLLAHPDILVSMIHSIVNQNLATTAALQTRIRITCWKSHHEQGRLSGGS